jgi:hypothetical protein
MAVRVDGHAAIEVCAIRARADRLEAVERLLGGVPVRVAGAGADDGDVRPECRQEGLGGGRPAAVVRDLEHVETTPVGQPTCEQLRVDGLLDVAGQQQPALSEAHVEHDRDIVDARAGIGRLRRHGATRWPADFDLGRIEAQMVAGEEPAARATEPDQRLLIGAVSGAGAPHARLRDGADPVARQQHGQTGDMVFVRMGDHDQVDAPVPGRESGVEHGQQAVRIRAGIDEQPRAVVALQQDGVALADVEHGEPQPAVRTCHGAEGDGANEQGQADGGDTRTERRSRSALQS